MIKLTPEQSAEAAKHPEGVQCQVEGTDKVFVIVDAQVHRKMKQAFYQQNVVDSINEGVADMEAGRGLPVEEADRKMRAQLGFPPPTTS